ncbi:MAG: acylphosphatase [Candidatus Dormibacteraeota bacterium]|uniref:acylphosphatase n=1 Tax=Candidatus Aeolococcus gillhamiae TaxID=3127015 RepID=A0A2W5ZHK4_9BACT|nr:acylphosphatase [Candidatus Dormibacteraeota bacterium]PZR82515.1 MAG: acylphosphatase [Candidatus Dormibacter sp. RRmetagenome_bin12]
MSEQTRVRATVRGRVQMVGFRAFVAHHAGDLCGTVANRPDGSVECVIEGPPDAVDRILELLHRGPAHAQVDAVDVLREPYRGDLPPFTVHA